MLQNGMEVVDTLVDLSANPHFGDAQRIELPESFLDGAVQRPPAGLQFLDEPIVRQDDQRVPAGTRFAANSATTTTCAR